MIGRNEIRKSFEKGKGISKKTRVIDGLKFYFIKKALKHNEVQECNFLYKTYY